MSNETKNMIDAATNTDGAAFKDAFDTAINEKVGDSLDVQRQDIAQNIFGNVRVPTEEARRIIRTPDIVIANRKLFAADKAAGKLTFFKFKDTTGDSNFQLSVVKKVKGLQDKGPVVGPTRTNSGDFVVAVKIGNDSKTRAEVEKFAKSLGGVVVKD